jgi:hypothetical protein
VRCSGIARGRTISWFRPGVWIWASWTSMVSLFHYPRTVVLNDPTGYDRVLVRIYVHDRVRFHPAGVRWTTIIFLLVDNTIEARPWRSYATFTLLCSAWDIVVVQWKRTGGRHFFSSVTSIVLVTSSIFRGSSFLLNCIHTVLLVLVSC